MKTSFITPSGYAEKILREDFKKFVEGYYKTAWHVLSDESLMDALAIFNSTNPRSKLERFWD
jgi:hypothetical protein